MPDEKIIASLHRYLQEEAGEEDTWTIVNWLDTAADNEEVGATIREAYNRYTPSTGSIEQAATPLARVEQNLRDYISESAKVYELEPSVDVRKLPRIRRHLPYAAAIALLIIAGSIIYYYNSPRGNADPGVAIVSPVPMQNDVAPGGNHATLTLADGKTITLDSAKNGLLATEGATSISKTEQGKIVYNAGNNELTRPLTYNTMSTPRGGLYELTLPDGTHVWLNAASSISYPTAFAQNERRVSITGEVYFEVAHNKQSPFRVEIGTPLGTKPIAPMPNAPTIEVLGTHFNINAYTEELAIKTTLLEGSVQIKNVLTSLTLKPGQQGVLTVKGGPVSNRHRLALASSPDVKQVMAWKNGLFILSNTDVPTIMRQISRWYDVDVTYEGTIPEKKLGGGLSRNLPLSEILDLLKNYGVQFRLEGKTLYVRP